MSELPDSQECERRKIAVWTIQHALGNGCPDEDALSRALDDYMGLLDAIAAWNTRPSLVDGVPETMVSRFLCWGLPRDFCPDGGVSLDERYCEKWGTWPDGTNLLTATQARQMLEHVIGCDAPAVARLRDLDALLALLKTTEVNDDGVEFSPVTISSSRVALSIELRRILNRLEGESALADAAGRVGK